MRKECQRRCPGDGVKCPPAALKPSESARAGRKYIFSRIPYVSALATANPSLTRQLPPRGEADVGADNSRPCACSPTQSNGRVGFASEGGAKSASGSRPPFQDRKFIHFSIRMRSHNRPETRESSPRGSRPSSPRVHTIEFSLPATLH